MSAESLFTNAFQRMVRSWSVITSFRTVGYSGLPYARTVLAQQNAVYIEQLTASGELDKFIIGIKDEEDRRRTGEWMHRQLTEQAIRNAESSIDSASIVFGHSLLDALLFDFLEVTMEVDKEYWREQVSLKQVTLASVRIEGYEKLLSDTLASKKEWLRRNASLKRKSEVLFAICKPKSGKFNETAYVFDVERLDAIDGLRQEIVHGDKLGEKLADTQANLDYIWSTCGYLLFIVNERFDVRINPAQMVGMKS